MADNLVSLLVAGETVELLTDFALLYEREKLALLEGSLFGGGVVVLGGAVGASW